MRMNIIYGMLAALVGLSGTIKFDTAMETERPSVSLQASAALARGPGSPRGAARRTGRRTARRTTRRVAHRTSVVGCPYRAPYYYCDGVYYRRVVESGTTVYVVVNP